MAHAAPWRPGATATKANGCCTEGEAWKQQGGREVDTMKNGRLGSRFGLRTTQQQVEDPWQRRKRSWAAGPWGDKHWKRVGCAGSKLWRMLKQPHPRHGDWAAVGSPSAAPPLLLLHARSQLDVPCRLLERASTESLGSLGVVRESSRISALKSWACPSHLSVV